LSAVEFFTPEDMAALNADVNVQEVRLNFVFTIVCHGHTLILLCTIAIAIESD